MILNSNIKYLIESLEEADTKTYSYQCPYLALADVLGYYTPHMATYLPSHFSRLSTRKMLLNSGIGTREAKRIWLMLEDGTTLYNIAQNLRRNYGYYNDEGGMT